jgi:hypothetical protein
MEVVIEGVRIKLTSEQCLLIEERRKEIERSQNSFKRVLKLFGFKKISNKYPTSYSHGRWHAEIHDHGGWHTVWMVGGELKSSSFFPGGWVYGSPKELSDELRKAVNG